MDVLAYSAFNAQKLYESEISQKSSCAATKCTETVAAQTLASSFTPQGACWTQSIEPCLIREPYRTAFWACIPSLSSPTGGLRIWDSAGGNFSQGICCLWTVPAGATCARFQIWGAGGNSSASACCGGSPFGSTGAYASVIIPVTAGNTYTLCAGCVYCCWSYCGSDGRRPGCSSFVIGPGLSNFCANGGEGKLGSWMAHYGKASHWRVSFHTSPDAGSCICCCGTSYCFINSCATCGEIPHIPGATYHGTTTNGSLVYGIRGMWPRICYDTNHFGYQIHPPIYSFENCSQCCQTWTSSCITSNTRKACCGCLQVPGAGGWAHIAMAGSNYLCGDMGRAGQVCVEFK